jgi:hypothetical protein
MVLPNPSLQRTRLRSPLNSISLGGENTVRGTLLLIVSLPFIASPGRLGACSCGGPMPTPKQAIQSASHVFVGTVVSVEPAPNSLGLGLRPSSEPAHRTVFRVTQRWKGASTPELSAYAFSNCAYTFERGGTYLVFLSALSSAPERAEASKCLPNQPLAPASAHAQATALLGPALRAQ